MERKIGEIFNYDGEWYQCVNQNGCCNCAFYNTPCHLIDELSCNSLNKKRKERYIFKKLEKAGEPYADYCPSGRVIYFQRYKCYQKPIYNGDFICWSDDISISIEIQQTKENMEEGNNTKHSNSENIGKNLKPFNLEAAKSGMPVCTRDGRKARIICFDRKDIKPIVALVTSINGDNINEKAFYYFEDGHHLSKYDNNINDLMMLPEKKEGWVNVYRDEESKRVYCGEFIFSEREKAEKHYECNDTKVATVSIGWEE